MGLQSIITGYIMLKSKNDIEQSKKTITDFEYDPNFPFTNIFGYISSEQYNFPLIIFGGSYKQIEYFWSEWLWKFSKLLQKLNAIEAQVNLRCVMGHFYWILEPETSVNNRFKENYMNDEWYIVHAPTNDFSIDNEWINDVKKHIPNYSWDKIIKRKIINIKGTKKEKSDTE